MITRAAASVAIDDALLALVADGDREAFATLYDRTAPRLLGLVRRSLLDRAQSEEVAQEVYLELWQDAARFDASKSHAMTWMLTVARRRAIDRVRSSQASRDRDWRIGIRDRPTEFDVVAETVESGFEHERVRCAMAGISAVQREALELTNWGDLTQTEAAARLGVKLPTIKTRVRGGLIALRRIMGVDAA